MANYLRSQLGILYPGLKLSEQATNFAVAVSLSPKSVMNHLGRENTPPLPAAGATKVLYANGLVQLKKKHGITSSEAKELLSMAKGFAATDADLASQFERGESSCNQSKDQPDQQAKSAVGPIEPIDDPSRETETGAANSESTCRITAVAEVLQGSAEGTSALPSAVIAAVLLAISLTSLTAAYYKGQEPLHDAWNYKFHVVSHPKYSDDIGLIAMILQGHGFRMGFLIEVVRCSLLIFIATFLLPSLFPATTESLWQLLWWRPGNRITSKAMIVGCSILLASTLLGGFELAQVHQSSQDLFNWGKRLKIYTHATPHDLDTYSLYLPYSLVNWCLLIPLFIIVPGFAVNYEHARNPSEAQNAGSRYLSLLMWMCICLLFESWLGIYTLSENGIVRAIFTWAIIASVITYSITKVFKRFNDRTTLFTWLASAEVYVSLACIALSVLHLLLLPACRIVSDILKAIALM